MCCLAHAYDELLHFVSEKCAKQNSLTLVRTAKLAAEEKRQMSTNADGHRPVTDVRTSFTAQPDPPAPALSCPACEGPLIYRQTVLMIHPQTVLKSIKPLERWDYFDCPRCGPFEFRHRTRKLRSSIVPT